MFTICEHRNSHDEPSKYAQFFFILLYVIGFGLFLELFRQNKSEKNLIACSEAKKKQKVSNRFRLPAPSHGRNGKRKSTDSDAEFNQIGKRPQQI